MKILTVTFVYPSANYPATGVFIHNQVKALRKQGVDIAALEIDLRSIRRKRKLGFSFDNYEGVPVYRMVFPCGPVPVLLPLLYRLCGLYAFRKIKKITSGAGIADIVHVHFGDLASYIKFLTTKYHIPMIITEHCPDAMIDSKVKRAERLCSDAYNNASAVISVSSALESKLHGMTETNIIVIPNILLPYFKYDITKRSNTFTFISVGRLEESKRFDIVIIAFAHIVQTYPDMKLVIVGDGAQRKKLRKIAEKYNVADKVELTGIVLNTALPAIYSSCHCFILPSMFETFGVVYAEAMACGLPVIATRCGGPEDFVNDDNGVMIPVDDLEATINAMKYVYENYSRFDCEKISKDIIGKCSEETVTKAICEVYKEVLTQPQ